MLENFNSVYVTCLIRVSYIQMLIILQIIDFGSFLMIERMSCGGCLGWKSLVTATKHRPFLQPQTRHNSKWRNYPTSKVLQFQIGHNKFAKESKFSRGSMDGQIIMTHLLWRNFLIVFLLKFRLTGRFLDMRNFRIIIKLMTLLSSSGEVFRQRHTPDFQFLCFLNKCDFSKLLHLRNKDIRINWSLI